MTPRQLVELLSPWLGSGPTYLAVASGLRGLALDGHLPVGARVPSERELATVLAVGRNTVTAAYDVLRDEGYLRSDHGAGSRVAVPAAVPARPDAEPGADLDLLDRAAAILPERRELLRQSRDALVAALARHLPDWQCVVPRAGMVLWVELPGLSATRLAARALEMGVRLTAGPRFTVRGTADRWLRLPYTLPAEQMHEVAALLREAADRTDSGTTTSRPPSRWTA